MKAPTTTLLGPKRLWIIIVNIIIIIEGGAGGRFLIIRTREELSREWLHSLSVDELPALSIWFVIMGLPPTPYAMR